jgi:hypothetical protein
MLRGKLTVIERALARGLDAAHRRPAIRHRRWILGALGHVAYERDDMQRARELFRQAGLSLDRLGAIRYAAALLPGGIRQPLRQWWRCLPRLSRTRVA